MNPVASKIAVDVALLPPPEVMELAIGLNQKLELETGQEQTVALGKEDFLPHLSLAMGIIKADQADQTVAALQRAISEIRPLSESPTAAARFLEKYHWAEYNGRLTIC